MPTTALSARLRREIEGDVLFGAFDRGRYATDASFYQVFPIGVVVPKTAEDVVRAVQIAGDAGVPVIPRGGGTSQSGQTVGRALILDTSRYLNAVLRVDAESHRAVVEPGIVLDHLNAKLRNDGLFFPVDVATASRATIGGMVGNNSAGARSIRYGLTVDNVHRVNTVLHDGAVVSAGPVPAAPARPAQSETTRLVSRLREIHAREAAELRRRLPRVRRNVAGYNLQHVADGPFNLASVLVGSEGTLGMFTEIEIDLMPIPRQRALAVCHFPSLREAMDATQHVVGLDPSAVELVDHTLIQLARDNPAFVDAVGRFLRGTPKAILLVEFSGDDGGALERRLAELDELMASRGLTDAVVPALDRRFQDEIWGVRKAALNIVMSMRGDRKPVSFIEDCAVPLEHLAEYADRLTEVFARHGTEGIWYAHASVGCLHVRPVLNLKDGADVVRLRSIAEEAHAIVREFKGSHSGEHGDGYVRSEFLEPMLGARIVRAFEDVKDAFDPAARFNPGKIVRPPRMDERSLFRYPPGYHVVADGWALDWSAWGGFAGAVEMCNNNGACRKRDPGVMCPSYRATQDEKDNTRGRANVLRLALSGQLGATALTSAEMREAMDLCVGCKGCRRECPTGVDMARMKIEFLHQYQRQHGVASRDRAVAWLPRVAPVVSRVARLANTLSRSPHVMRLAERTIGLSARRALPAWSMKPFRAQEVAGRDGPQVALWVDTFNTYFEPENARAAVRLLHAAGYAVSVVESPAGGRPPCCGRTFLNAGLVDEARTEAGRTLDALRPFVERGVPVVGLEPSCLLTVRDEFAAILPRGQVEPFAGSSMLLEEFLLQGRAAGDIDLSFNPMPGRKAVVHGHCHQKAFGVDGTVTDVLRWIPGLSVEPIHAGCCGMAGAFGYEAEHFDMSMRMAELELLPAVRAAAPDDLVIADGTSCRHQIEDGTGREARHAARVLADALAAS